MDRKTVLYSTIKRTSGWGILKWPLLGDFDRPTGDKQLDEVLGAGYGIFAGKKVQLATLIFSPKIARWVSNELWHNNQKGRFLKDGSYELKIPYSDDTELLMDILRYGSGVKVISPANLVRRVLEEVDKMKLAYSGKLQLDN
jgi:predicted DNA-binding transcriptional regulator YafY